MTASLGKPVAVDTKLSTMGADKFDGKGHRGIALEQRQDQAWNRGSREL